MMVKSKIIGSFKGKLYTNDDFNNNPKFVLFLIKDINWLPTCRMPTDTPKTIKVDDRVKVYFT